VLKAVVLAGVAKAQAAIQDLAVSVKHVKRGAVIHVPGSAPTYPETLTNVSMVFTRYQSKEIDNDRIQASDWRGIVFPASTLPVFNTNDIIRIAAGLQDIIAGDYRIINDDKIIAGDTVVLHQLQLRKT
jgi:hypothetical protein